MQESWSSLHPPSVNACISTFGTPKPAPSPQEIQGMVTENRRLAAHCLIVQRKCCHLVIAIVMRQSSSFDFSSRYVGGKSWRIFSRCPTTCAVAFQPRPCGAIDIRGQRTKKGVREDRVLRVTQAHAILGRPCENCINSMPPPITEAVLQTTCRQVSCLRKSIS